MATSLMRHAHGLIEPSHGSSILARVHDKQDRHLKHKSRRSAERDDKEDNLGAVVIRTASVSGAALTVGLIQGYRGSSKIGPIPGELVVGVALHGLSLSGAGKAYRSLLRAVGDGALAAGMATLGYAWGAKHRAEGKAKPAGKGGKTGVSGEEPATGGAALSDEELARFANHR